MIPVTGVITLLFLEVLNPFYIFQLFSFCLWFADDYVYYAMAILIMSAFGVIMSIIQTRRVSMIYGENFNCSVLIDDIDFRISKSFAAQFTA